MNVNERVHPKMKILSLITHPHVVPKLYLRLFSEHKFRYFVDEIQAFWPCIKQLPHSRPRKV